MDWRAPNGKLLRLQLGDITKIPVDAIVNPANSALAGGGGVDGAIHKAGGPSIMRELRGIREKIGTLPPGHSVITIAGKLPAKYIIHTVGPIYRGGNHGEAELLASCYFKSLQLADDQALKSISFPSISTGAFGYPLEEAAPIAIAEIQRQLIAGCTIEQVLMVLFDRVTLAAYAAALTNSAGSGSASPSSPE